MLFRSQGEVYDFPADFLKKRVHRITRPTPVKEELEDLADAIKSSKKPLLIVGGGVKYSEAGEAVAHFCERHNIPFCETQAGKTAIKSSHPLNVGGLGVTGNSSANTLAKACDLIIAVGTRFTDFTTASKSLYSDKQVVTLNMSPFHASKLEAIKAVGDAKAGIIALDELLGDYKSGYTTQIAKAKADWEKEMDRLTHIEIDKNYKPEIDAHMPDVIDNFIKQHGEAMAQTTAIGVIRRCIPSDAIIVGSAGSLPGDLQRMWTSDEKDSYNMEYGYSCMGYEVAATLGVKFAEPDNEVYCVVGDSSFQMLHSEIMTIMQEQKKVNILIFDNCGFGCINNLEMNHGIGSLATEFRYTDGKKPTGDLIPVDYAKIGEGYGLKTYTCRTIAELEAALEDAKKQDIACLFDLKVIPKTMTDGYESWWDVGIAMTSTKESVRKAAEGVLEGRREARKY